MAQAQTDQQEDRILSNNCSEPYLERGAFPGDKM